ncbi:hypothetical protein B9479_005796 [Cryptococcus floricola]|uniref:Transcription activator of gluconeogenesis ERT1 n=1 Tax=Cryptococcus floricola TaxID=2591691 RepID=A0A5D3ATQ4_9TREE|nr:hypothetical protein B9479_005796 [Cryptococcus floricola]
MSVESQDLEAIARMQERQAQWGYPTGSLSPAESPQSYSSIPLSHSHSQSQGGSPHLFNFMPPHQRPAGVGLSAGGRIGANVNTGFMGSSVNPSGFGVSGGMHPGSHPFGGRPPTIASVDQSMLPAIFENHSGRGRPKSKLQKAKPQGLGSERKSRKKVAKACLACQKSHLTCDEQRPCTRCIKKGMADKCVEGVRKKAKYLMEGDERVSNRPSQASSMQSTPQSTTVSLPAIPQLSNAVHDAPTRIPDDVWLANAVGRDQQPINLPTALNITQPDIWAGTDLGPSSFPSSGGINGTAANNEYQMLDAMFASLSPVYPGLNDPLDEAGRQLLSGSNSLTNSNPLDLANTPLPHPNPPLSQNTYDQPWLHPSPQSQQSQGTFQTPPGSSLHGISPEFGGTGGGLSPGTWGSWSDSGPAGQIMLDGSSVGGGSGVDLGQVRGPGAVENRLGQGMGMGPRTGSEIYRNVIKPFDYTQGYHVLMDYLAKHFETPDVLRVVQSLASFRPSLIALQMPMSEEDEVFLERSFQRTLLELEKLISYSATPTAVWRRTGEICYANPEFAGLVKRSEGELVGKGKFIYELFDKPSVVSYWENFSVHAFENTTQNFFQPISLSTSPDAAFNSNPNYNQNQEAGGMGMGMGVGAGAGLLGCTCCLTIRRDVFDLPSVVIGQFLPVPK